MVLEQQKPSKHNTLLRYLVPSPKPTKSKANDDELAKRPAKRVKRTTNTDENGDLVSAPPSPKPPANTAVEPSDEAVEELPASQVQTDLESALPPIETDKEAIEAYEAGRAAEQTEEQAGGRNWVKGRSSIYVDAFNLALDTVLEDESHLFDEAETEVFRQWRELGYEAQYLYVRLFLRKTSAWHRVNTLGYHGDIADIESAIETLQQIRELPESNNSVQTNPGKLEPPEGTDLGTSFAFADKSEEHIATLEEASSLLRLDELKGLAKDAKVQGRNKTELLDAFRRTSQRQAGLGWVGLKRSDTGASIESTGTENNDRGLEESPRLEEASRDAHWIRTILAETGSCIRLSLAPYKLFERVHLVFYRSTEWTEKSLTTIILARIARRNFPEYIVSRSANIFASRSLLLEFEAALRTQHRIDSILEFSGNPGRDGLQAVLDVFEEVYPRWLTLLAEEQEKEDSIYLSGEGAYLRRLSPAWVYTRIVHKGAYVLGKLKEHKREHELLTELLTQRLFHASRRGMWYQRKALLEEHYMAALTATEGRGEEAQKRHWKQISLQTCENGLQDPLVHLIYHYDLQKRVIKLEKALKVAKRFQHNFGHVQLAAPVEVTVEGIRIEKEPTASATGRRGAKTVWLNEQEDNSECSVEAMCLAHYRAQGWKGYHSEGGIVRTLFAYLFYDILFSYVPNVFQTAFQTCPLDLHTDGFFAARLSAINHRLAGISNGEAAAHVRAVWDAHAARRTCVVGLDWTFALEDLLQIARCFDGAALAAVCKVLAQEYGQRGGGVPDLFLWHEGRGEVMFAEVKSENDRLSDTQRLWIHVLTGAGVRVELCNAVAREVRGG
ncbi:uncharacterized protein K452DRAFT_355372 [Aplosporella prunicola CBS 121167]|uniref:Fanconi-associated nuclease n=1 Tax=Aplosporella prunicola CBS 121167 TaxID=1176127 RepID=A0A6A6BUM3_9PEZI|nr:uncharacterized protein K452DRAFT_355372 [Aplosporella prunicola CBS 121167]KAF2146975.1 hypothetical protein K452DRAFT_355372 [Aplosporella prunicola CBS 121167]